MTPDSCPYLCQLLTDFQNSFAATLSRKFAVERSHKLTSNRKHVATLFCEIFVFKNVPTESTATADQ